MQGWIKLYRELLDKPIWQCSTPEQKTIFITILLLANHKERQWEWQGKPFKCKPGQFITSIPSLVEKCGKNITPQKLRTALNKFEKYGFLTDESTNNGRLITIANWGLYQDIQNEINMQTNRQVTVNQHSSNRQVTSNKNVKNEISNIYSSIIEYLNKKADTRYRSTTKKTQSYINARINEGFKENDFYTVIDKKVEEWQGTDMEKYLRPETLFGTKFESYLNQKNKAEEKNKSIYGISNTERTIL